MTNDNNEFANTLYSTRKAMAEAILITFVTADGDNTAEESRQYAEDRIGTMQELSEAWPDRVEAVREYEDECFAALHAHIATLD